MPISLNDQGYAAQFDQLRQQLTKLENKVPHMYLDTEGVVTIGIGHAIKTVALAKKLPFLKADGSSATPAEIETEFNTIHALPAGMKYTYYQPHTTLHLDEDGIEQIFRVDIEGAPNGSWTRAKNSYNNRFGAGSFDHLPWEIKEILNDIAFNGGLNRDKTWKLVGALRQQDWIVALAHSRRYDDQRTVYTRNLIQELQQQAEFSAALQQRVWDIALGNAPLKSTNPYSLLPDPCFDSSQDTWIIR
ncbi:MAG: hypothetical protein LBG61_02160 [Burkholderiales bacterium]|jgi:GH24 family phage-related lysozyme (muramidase)|nr:hypothetical protein [Burkholderiales bacterium]